MKENYSDVKKRYEGYREIVRKSVKIALPYKDSENIHLSSINSKALNQTKNWTDNFDWEKAYREAARKYEKRFELAIWYNDKLVSISLGRPSDHKTRLRLELIERINDNSLIKGRAFPIVEQALMAYCDILGANEIRIMEPINLDIRNYYLKHGYNYIQSTGKEYYPDYCWKKL